MAGNLGQYLKESEKTYLVHENQGASRIALSVQVPEFVFSGIISFISGASIALLGNRLSQKRRNAARKAKLTTWLIWLSSILKQGKKGTVDLARKLPWWADHALQDIGDLFIILNKEQTNNLKTLLAKAWENDIFTLVEGTPQVDVNKTGEIERLADKLIQDLNPSDTPKQEGASLVSTSLEKPKNVSRIDKIFELCLLLITVIAAGELQYASFIYSSKDTLSQVNYFFRVSTIPIIILVTTWIVMKLFPSLPSKVHVLRRFVKEFCWTLFGNLFALEIIVFVYLGFSTELDASMVWGQYGTLLSVLLTFPATWQYRKADQENGQNMLKPYFPWITLLEHAVLYFLSYGLLRYIMFISGTVPMP